MKSFAGFTLLRPLGEHSWMARQEVLDRQVVLRHEPDQGERSRRLFALEAETLAKLKNYGVPGIHAFGQEKGHFFFVRDYIEGVSLAQMLETPSHDRDFFLRKVIEVCETLDQAHFLGLVHRNICPQNIIIDVEGNARLIGFQLARRWLDQSLSRSPERFATNRYASPEQRAGKEQVTGASDIWSLGKILQEIGEATSWSKDLQTVVRRALENHPGKRYLRPAELAADLRRMRQGLPLLEAGMTDRVLRWGKHHAGRSLLIAGSLAMLAAAGFYSWHLKQSFNPLENPHIEGAFDRAVRRMKEMGTTAYLEESLHRLQAQSIIGDTRYLVRPK